ncbi:prepilin-type N-terminal cleavage/methylation domain-containing protein [Hyphomicrobium sp. 99]|uniref:type IV pilus modification PilV family protein n=1 Tax=Hyphomicrobium sp. 99 TaxID=1163419 RepID=UPI0005F77E5C|nr:prepilin-type N-terminal cleavage/methylation domain-containing protein [Hyphomicrobium sp. 99]
MAEDPRAGFTLLETMTALTILAIAFVSLYEAHSAAMRTASAATDGTRARIVAQSLLAEATSGWNIHPGSRSGTDGRFNWSIVIAREEAPWGTIKSNQWRLNRIRVAVTWDRARRVQLDTLKFGRSDE